MKRFCVNVLLFVLPLLLVLGFFEQLLRSIPNDYSYKHAFWVDRPNDIQALVLGSSHSFFGVDPSYFTRKGFNASHVSQSIDLDHQLLLAHEQELDSLSFVLIPISYHTLFGRLDADAERWRLKNYVIYHDLPISNAPSDHLEILNGRMLSLLGRARAYLRKGRTDITCTEFGCSDHRRNKKADLRTSGRTAALRHTTKERARLEDNIEHLKAIIAIARRKSARILLFTPPAYSTYREHMDADQWRVTQDAIRPLLDGPDISYHDLLAEPSFVDTDFRDADHLGRAGATKLSRMLDSLMLAESSTAPLPPASLRSPAR